MEHPPTTTTTPPFSCSTPDSFLNTGKGVALMGLCIFSGGGFFITKLSSAVENPSLQQALSLLLVFWCAAGLEGLGDSKFRQAVATGCQPLPATHFRSVFTLKTTYTYAKQAWNGPPRQQALEQVGSPAFRKKHSGVHPDVRRPALPHIPHPSMYNFPAGSSSSRHQGQAAAARLSLACDDPGFGDGQSRML